MPELRVTSIVYGKGGFEPTLPNNNVLETITSIISDEQLYQEQLAQQFNAAHEQAILALNNWSALTMAQKDTILKNLVKYALWKEGWLKLGIIP